MTSPRQALARAFGCDLRSLALFRIALGLVLIADIAWRIPLFGALFSPDGAWPLAAAWNDAPVPWSPYFWVDAAWWTQSLFALSVLVSTALLLGWHTRAATIAAWLLLAALHQRNTLVMNAGDTWLRLLLFWSTFLPLGACWSLDSRRARTTQTGTITTPATVALLGQVALVYIFNAHFKTGDSWKVTADATAAAFRLETYATPLARALLEYPALLQAATRAVWWIELLGPLLAFIPWRNGFFRIAAAALFIGFHASLLLTLRIGLFPVIGMVAWLPFLPAAFWERIIRLRSGGGAPAPPALPGIFAGVLFAYVLTWNVWGCFQRLPEYFRLPGHALGLNQRWALFAPNPLLSEGRMVAVIETTAGIGYDAFTGAVTDWKRPQNLGDMIPSAQWRKYLAAVREKPNPERARFLADWLRRDWQQHHPEHTVQRVRLHYLWEWTAKRQSPPDNWLIYENPPGPIGEMARAAGGQPVPPVDRGDN